MALTTVAFCEHCKWRSSPSPIALTVAGAPCPKCSSGVSALHYDPAYVGTDVVGRPYVEADAAAAHLVSRGVSAQAPLVATALPTHT